MLSTKIICTTTDELFKCSTTLELQSIEFESQSVSDLLNISSSESCCYIHNCIINNSINIDINDGNVIDLSYTTIDTKRKIKFDNIDNLSINQIKINSVLSSDDLAGIDDSMFEVQSCDVYNFDCTMNMTFKYIDSTDLNYFKFSNSFVKSIDINYNNFFLNINESTLVFDDNVICNFFGYWYGGDGIYGCSMFSDKRLEYITINTPSNGTFFGDVLYSAYDCAACSDGTIGLFGGGKLNTVIRNDINEITFAIQSSAVDFGDLTTGRQALSGGSNGIIGIFAGGGHEASTVYDDIDYVTFASRGNTSYWGNLIEGRRNMSECSSNTEVLFAGGVNSEGAFTDDVDYITTHNYSHAYRFSNLLGTHYGGAGCSDRNTALFGSGYNITTKIIQYTSFDSHDDCTEFGDLTEGRLWAGSCSDGIYGVWIAGEASRAYIDVVNISNKVNSTRFGNTNQSMSAISACSGN